MQTFADFVESVCKCRLKEWQIEFLNDIYGRIKRGEKLLYIPARAQTKTDPILLVLLHMIDYETRKEVKIMHICDKCKKYKKCYPHNEETEKEVTKKADISVGGCPNYRELTLEEMFLYPALKEEDPRPRGRRR